jgi:transposase InsO family protein
LTDSGLRVKNPGSPHEDTVIQTDSPASYTDQYKQEALKLWRNSGRSAAKDHRRFATFTEARTAIFEYIETFYNRTRLHSSLAYRSPLNFELQLN